jgi:hypothetical protein
MKSHLKLFLTFLFVAGVVYLSCGQSTTSITCNGTSTATLNATVTYSAVTNYTSYAWTVSGGTYTSSSSTVTVTWNTVGTGRITYTACGTPGGGFTCTSQCSMDVTVSEPPPPNPSLSISVNKTSLCDTQSLEFTAVGNSVVPNSTTFTWSKSGTSYNTGTNPKITFSVTNNTSIPYAFHPGDVVSVTASNGATATYDYVNHPITILPRPESPAVSDQSFCGTGSITLSATPGAYANHIRWYNGDGTFIQEDGTISSGTITPPQSKDFLVSSYNSSNGCENAAPFKVIANYYPNVPVPGNNNNKRCGPGSITLTATIGANGDEIHWLELTPDPSTTTKATTPTLTQTTTYTIATRNSVTGCESNQVSIVATIGTIPGLPTATDGYGYIDETVNLSATPDIAGNTVNWYVDPASTPIATGLSFTTPPLTDETKYYISSVNSIPCEGPRTVIIYAHLMAINFVSIYDVTVPQISDPTTLTDLSVTLVNKSTSFLDGLARPIQTVVKQGSTAKQDVVYPVTYDNTGRLNRKYLPFTFEQTGRFKTQDDIIDNVTFKYKGVAQTFYSNADNVANDDVAFAETRFEPSPLNRIAKQGAPGTLWQMADTNPLSLNDNTIKKRYELNLSTDNLIMFSYDFVSGLIVVDPLKYYPANTLYTNTTYDEKNNIVIEYIDKEGHTICKKVQYKTETDGTKTYTETYYIYDDFGNLTVVVPPEGVQKIKSIYNLN